MAARLVTNPVFAPESTPFAEIAAAVRTRLSAYTGINIGYVLPVANDQYKVTVDENFFLYLQFFGIEAFGDTGGGRLNPWAYRRLRVYVYTRQGVDPYGADEVALQGVDSQPAPATATDELPVGQYQAEELVIGALFNWMPLNASLRPMLTEPIHPSKDSGPATRKPENDAGLVRTNLDFQLRYGLAIDKTDPPL